MTDRPSDRSDQSATPRTGDEGLGMTTTLHEDDAAQPIRLEPDGLAAGTQIGRYTVIAPVGQGGMGVVYMAYDPQLDRRVAIKLLRSELGRRPSESQRRRMLREAQAMAKVAHPNVVAVYDAGEWQERIFISMELVRGESLGAWLRRTQRPWREVLEAFLEAARGLQAAHEAGMVHRDFKPDNVLVGDDGRVRVTDFGLAIPGDSLDSESGPAHFAETGAATGRVTHTGARVGTPAYMPLEQFRGEAVDERGDQFSFCAALYQGLYGRLPFRGESFDDLAAAVERHEVVPAPEGSDVPPWLRRVILRGLAPRAEDRWPSLPALVTALQPRRWPWTRIGLGAIVLAGGAALLLPGRASPCDGAAQRGEQVWNDARREAIEDRFAQLELAYADDVWSRVQSRADAFAQEWTRQRVDACEATRVRQEISEELLDLRNACLDRRLDRLDALAHVLEDADTAVVDRAVEAADGLGSLDVCEDAEFLRAQVKPPEDPDDAAKVERLRTRLAGAQALFHAGRFETATGELEPLLTEAEDLDYDPVLAEVLLLRGQVQEGTGDYEAARQSLTEAAQRATRAGDDRLAGDAASQLVYVVGVKLHDIPEGLQWAGHARAMLERSGLPRSRWTGLALHLASIYRAQGDLERSVELQLEAIEAKRSDGRAPAELARNYNNLATVLFDLERTDEAMRYAELALDTWRESLGPLHPYVAIATNNVGVSWSRRGRCDEAVPLLREALRITEASLGPQHPDAGLSLINLMTCLAGQGETDEALAHGARAVENFARADDPREGTALAAWAGVLLDDGRASEAESAARRAQAKVEASHGADHASGILPRRILADAVSQQGRHEEATAVAEQALATAQRTPARVRDLARCHELLAMVLVRDPAAAPARVRKAARLAQTHLASIDEPVPDELSPWLDDEATPPGGDPL